MKPFQLRYLIIVLCIVVSTMTVLVAQESVSSKELTLEEAIRIGLQQNKDLATARLEVDKADARVREAIGNALPAIDFSGRYTKALEKPVFFLPDFQDLNSGRTVPIRIGSDHAIDMTLSARQILFNSAVFIGVGASKTYSAVARDLYRAKAHETVARIQKAYYGAVLAGEFAELMRSNLNNSNENLRTVTLLTQQGLLSEYDFLRASVGVANLRPVVIQAENSYALALDGLKAVMGVGPSEQFHIKGQLTFEPVDETLLATAPERVIVSNPSLGAMRKQIDVNKAYKGAYRSDYLPTLAAFGNYQYQLAKNSLNISTADFQRSSLVGLSLTFNLFEGFQTSARVEQAELEVRKTEEQVSNLEINLRTFIHSLTLQINQARQRIEAQEKTVEQAEQGYKIAGTRLRSGSGTQLEVNDAQLALNQAKVNKIQAIYDYLVAVAELHQALGVLPENITHEFD
jgi:outer membrane protein